MNDNPRANGSRGRDPYAALRLIALIAAIVGVIVLAAAAFVLSYGGIHKIALSAGVSPNVARIFPVIFDAMLVVSCAAVVSLRSAGWWQRAYSWLSLLALLVVVAAADAVHATGTHIPRKPAAATVAILPWALLLLAFSLLLSMLRQFRRARAAAADAAAAGGSRDQQRRSGNCPGRYDLRRARAEGNRTPANWPRGLPWPGPRPSPTHATGTGGPLPPLLLDHRDPSVRLLIPRLLIPRLLIPRLLIPRLLVPHLLILHRPVPRPAEVAQARPPEPPLRLGQAAACSPATRAERVRPGGVCVSRAPRPGTG